MYLYVVQCICIYTYGLPTWLSSKESACSAGDGGSVPGSGRSPGEGNGNHSSIVAWKSHEQRSLEGYSPWGRKKLDTTEQLSTHTYNWSEITNMSVPLRGESDTECVTRERSREEADLARAQRWKVRKLVPTSSGGLQTTCKALQVSEQQRKAS